VWSVGSDRVVATDVYLIAMQPGNWDLSYNTLLLATELIVIKA